MGRPKKVNLGETQEQQPIAPHLQQETPDVIPMVKDSASAEVQAVIEEVQAADAPVTVPGKKIQPSAHQSAKKPGVYLRSLMTGKIIAGPINEKLAQQQVKAYPTKVEISHDGK